MKKLLILFICVFSVSFSQVANEKQKQIDSLNKELRTDDVNRKIDVLIKLAQANFLYNSENALNYAYKSLNLAIKKGRIDAVAKSYDIIGTNYSVIGEFDSSEVNLKKAQELYETLDSTKKVADMYAVMAINLNNQYKHKEVLVNLKKAINIYKEIGEYQGLAAAYSNYGLALMQLSKHSEALEKFFLSVDYFKKSGNTNRAAEPYTNIGNCFVILENFDNALEYFEKALNLYSPNDASMHTSILYNNIGTVYLNKRNMTKAGEYFAKALKMNRVIGNKRFLSMNLSNLANIEMHQGNLKDAGLHLEEAINFAKEIESLEQLEVAYFYKGVLNKLDYEIGLANGKKNTELLKQSVDFLLIAEKYSKEIGDKKRNVDILLEIADAQYTRGEFKSGYDRLLEYSRLKDSLDYASSVSKVMSIESLKENELKSKQIEFLKKENSYKSELNYLFIIVSILVLIIMYFFYLRYRNKNQRNIELEQVVNERTQELQVANEKIIKSFEKEKEISDLKTNIILNTSHQFRTPLTAISAYIELIKLKTSDNADLVKPIDNTQKAVFEMVSLITQIEQYHTSQVHFTELNISECNILDVLNDAVNKVKFIYQTNHIVSIKNNLLNNSIKTDCQLLQGSLQSIIDNAFKFSNPDSIIRIDLSNVGEKIKIEIIDEGVGISENELPNIFDPLFVGQKHVGIKKGNGFGLPIAKSNLSKIDAEINVESEVGKGTIVRILI